MSIFQAHVHTAAKEDLAESELFTSEDKLELKETQLVNQLSVKDVKSITTKELNKLKDIARKHVTASVRVQLWLILSGGIDVKKTTPTLYKQTYDEIFSQADFIPDGMDEDGEYLTYYLTEDGGKSLRQMMCIVKHLNPDITFCPLMEPIVSILLHFMNEEDCFAVVCGLLAHKTNPFLAQTKADNIIADATLQDLFKSVNGKAYERIKSFVPPELNKENKLVLFPNWQRMVFEQLDFICLVRILDCLMVEGSKILFRMGLYLLTAFYTYAMSFRKLSCTSTHELLATIGQYTHSQPFKPDDLMTDILRISITTKQMEKCNTQNRNQYKSNQLEYSEDYTVNVIVAIDLNQVSDIITPMQWQVVCQWLPSRIQIKQPQILFSTEKDGYNLKTLYLLCENEEQTLIIIQTDTKEIFGAYLSHSLLERHDGRQNLSYFGTGETFIFRLQPDKVCYHWNETPAQKQSGRTKKIRKYVFVDTTPVQTIPENSRAESTDSKLKRKRKSFKRSLSLNVRGSKSNPSAPSEAPLKLINIRRNVSSVPRHLYLGAKLKLGVSTPPQVKENKRPILKTAQSYDVAYRSELRHMHNMCDTIDQAEGDLVDIPTKSRSMSEGGVKPKLKKCEAITEEPYDVIEEETAPEHIGKPGPVFAVGSDQTLDKRMELFISCDNTQLIVGGGGGEAIWIDEELANGHSTRCNTFKNESLTKNSGGEFRITRVDVFGFQ